MKLKSIIVYFILIAFSPLVLGGNPRHLTKVQVLAMRAMDDDFFAANSKPQLNYIGSININASRIDVIQGELIFGEARRLGRRIFFINSKSTPIGCIYNSPFPLVDVRKNKLIFKIDEIEKKVPCGETNYIQLDEIDTKEFDVGCERIKFTRFH